MATDAIRRDRAMLLPRLPGRLVWLWLIAVLASAPVFSATMEFAPEVEAGTGYTDNVRLTSDDEEDEWLFWMRPAFVFSRDADRLDLAARYALDAFVYGGKDTNFSHRFNGNALAEIVRDTFFLDASLARFQGLVDPERSYSFGNLPRSGNRTDITRFDLRPYLRQEFGDDGLVFLSYQYGQLWYDDGDLQDSKRHVATFNIGDWDRNSGVTWRANYNYTKVEYDVSNDFEYQIAYGELGLWVSRYARIFGAYGLETDYEDIESKEMDDQSWEAGFELEPNKRLRLLLAAGERSWGSTWRGTFRYEVQRFTTDISYNETPYTPGLDGYARLPFPDEDDPDDSLDRPGAGGRYVFKRFQWRTTYDLPKSSWTFRVYQGKKDNIILDQESDLDPDELGNEESRGASLRWHWDAGSRTMVSILGQFAHRKFADIEREDDIWRVRAEVEYELGPRTFANVAYQHSKQDPDSNDDSGYTANTLGFWIRRTF